MKALFLTFEGLDGSGKSTHLRRAAEWLTARGERVHQTREPGGTPLSDAIRGIFLDRRWKGMDARVEAMLVFASRRQHLLEVIEPKLADGVHVLCDRFTDSSLAYQGGARGLGAEWVLELDRLATDGRRPDYTMLFDLPPEVALERGQRSGRKDGAGPDRIDVEGLNFYRQVREEFLAQAEAEPERFRIVDSRHSAPHTWVDVETVLESIFGATQ